MKAGSLQFSLNGVVALAMTCSFLACGGGGETAAKEGGSTPLVTVTLTPGTAEVAALDSMALTATVTGSSNTQVQWTVDGVENGNATVGTIVGSGASVAYQAPHAEGTHLLVAAAKADPSRKGTSTIRVASRAIAIGLTPLAATLTAGSTQTLTASVSGAANTGVTWTVDGILNGHASVGLISGSGATVTYTAPTGAGTHAVTATSTADPTKLATCNLTIQAAPVVVGITLSPAATTLSGGESRAFTAVVTGTTNTAVTWSVDGVANGNTTVGTVSGPGNTATYAAPALGGTHVLKATSAADPTKFATASVAVNATPPVALGPSAAFPGCEGMGCGATGGRGGVVYTVNTLLDTTNPDVVPGNGPNGPTCSLRDAMTKSGPRTIVFSVGGTITLHSTIYPVPPNLTIAGQTAPGGGIQITGDGTFGSGSALLYLGGNTIVRYLRIRPGNTPVNSADQGLSGISVSMADPHDVVIDHCSFEWDGNKAVSWWSDSGVRRNTFSWNLDAESLAAHSTGLLVGGFNMGQANLDQSSWDGHHNMLATIDHRLPYTNLKYGRWVHNYVMGYNYAALVRGGTQFDFIGNVWDGVSSGIRPTPTKAEVRWADSVAHNEGNIIPGGTAKLHLSNNFGPSNPTGSLDDFSTMLRTASSENGQLNDVPVSSTYKSSTPVVPAALNAWPITITPLASGAELKTLLAATVGAYQRLGADGAWVPNRDSLDARVISYILNPATSPTALVPSAGTLPTLAAGTPIVSTVGDGIPDTWKVAHGLSTSDPSVANTIRPNAHGFTVLELYLSGLFPNGSPLP